MITTIIGFFGGSVFRMIWGEVSSWMTAKQDHKFEIERMRLQAEVDAAQHARNQDAIRLQAELGVKTIQVQAESDLSRIDADIFGRGVELTGRLTGFALVDIWNGIIRPMLATECMLLWSLHLYRHNWTLDDQGWALVGAALARRFEGLFLTPYLCPAGVPTIAYGATYYEDGTRVTLTDPKITPARAELLLLWMVRTVYLPAVLKLCPGVTDPRRLAALIDFAFNLGTGNLRSSTLRKRVNAGRWGDVPAEFRKWIRGGGKKLRGLVLRREAEISLI